MDLFVEALLALGCRLYLTIEHESEETPISTQVVRPELITRLEFVKSTFRVHDIRLFLTYADLFVQCA